MKENICLLLPHLLDLIILLGYETYETPAVVLNCNGNFRASAHNNFIIFWRFHLPDSSGTVPSERSVVHQSSVGYYRVCWSHLLSNGFSLSPSTAYQSPNLLKGQHLRIIWPRWEGNPKGLSGPVKGGVLINYLAARFNFTYEHVRVTENRLEPTQNGRGLFSYLFDNQSDLIVSAIVPTFSRLKIVDITLPWSYGSYVFLLPIPDESANIYAVAKPFQWPVWLGLIMAIFCVITILNLLQRYLEYRSQFEIDSTPNNLRKLAIVGDIRRPLNRRRRIVAMVGGPCTSNRLPFRLVAGVWTLAAFIFVQAYTSTLFTYVVAPVNHPLIDSLYDIADNPEIHLLVKNEGTPDRYFTAGVYQMDAIKEDYEKTGQCNFQLAKEDFNHFFASMSLPKNSRYTDTINKGLLDLQQTGIIDHWDSWFRTMPRKCMANIKYGYNTETKPSPLTLKNLTGAFVVLLIGSSLSLLTFLCEKILSMRKRHRRRINKL
ncbi:hypothetical protein DAPPUDRAFT_241227 [Daphnia pulex]|uniref:Ionotropic glutamate receptor C-terminal domain-containing protein n=1 Tax=Daphnia pulex TaxID=6669 RepID=E9GDR4_DAPPU|nr:hypothetical protein DAPPUDRAFT_241227 [Daphnia pulex]|eukprot:EFX82128.1 hypothetical protein DAPPUDRAFT_241227 [Daphnia pulex]